MYLSDSSVYFFLDNLEKLQKKSHLPAAQCTTKMKYIHVHRGANVHIVINIIFGYMFTVQFRYLNYFVYGSDRGRPNKAGI